MIAGYFTVDGLPYVRSHIILPRLGFFGSVHFLIDTGSDTTILHPDDGMYLGFPFEALTNPAEVISVSGIQDYYVEDATISFADDVQAVDLDIELFVAKPQPELEGLDSLLGRDVLNRLGMEYDFRQQRLWLTR